jgi:stage II sporulation protein AA (anti-sigma F factor antagonist)
MGSDRLDFTVSRFVAEGVYVLCPVGELDLAVTEVLSDAIAAVEAPALVIDLSGLTFIDSSGLKVLVAAKRRFDQEGGKLRVEGAEGSVRRVFELAGLADVLLTTNIARPESTNNLATPHARADDDAED